MIKKLLPLLLLILIGCSSPEPINYQMLVQRDGLYYLKDTNEIYSGPVFNIKGKSTGYIKKGKWNGEFEYYHSNGQLNGIGSYKDGDGSDLGTTGIPKSGREGLWKFYYENGQLVSEVIFNNGKEDGPYKTHHENGQLWAQGTIKDGNLDGPYKMYYENGQLEVEGTWKDGELIDFKEY
jgi:antitoxin component YwqK of YwqJK toxin-antitoxin module